MKSVKFIISTVLIIVSITHTWAQKVDTLSQARTLAYAKNYNDALVLLNSYNKNNSYNSEAVRLQLQLLYWTQNISKAKDKYETYIFNYPEDYHLKLDFGKMLFELNELSQSEKVLKQALQYDSLNVEANYTLGLINYWNGKINDAKKYLNKSLIKAPQNENAKAILAQIKSSQNPYIHIDNTYYSDQQPITKNITNLDFGFYKSRWLSPKISLQSQQIANYNNSFQATVGNTFAFNSLKLKINTTIGLAKMSAETNNLKLIGNISFDKQIFKYITWNTGISQNTYNYTISSLNIPVTHQDFTTSLSWGKTYQSPNENVKFFQIKNWNIKTAYTLQSFNDNNKVQNTYAWILSPPVGLEKIKLRLGYAFSHSNADKIKYSSSKSLSDILNNWSNSQTITGVYSPYFTPIQQNINALIGQINYTPNPKLTFGLKASYALAASAKAPYLTLNSDNSFLTNSSSVNYTPFEIKALFNYKVSSQFNLETSYTYSRAFFFDSQLINLNLNYIFNNAK